MSVVADAKREKIRGWRSATLWVGGRFQGSEVRGRSRFIRELTNLRFLRFERLEQFNLSQRLSLRTQNNRVMLNGVIGVGLPEVYTFTVQRVVN